MIALKGVKNEISLTAYCKMLSDGSKEKTIAFTCTWAKLEVDEAMAAIKRIQAAGRRLAGLSLPADDTIEQISERDEIAKHLKNVTGLIDANDNEELKYDDALLDALMANREYKAAVLNSFFEAQTGKKNLAVKN